MTEPRRDIVINRTMIAFMGMLILLLGTAFKGYNWVLEVNRIAKEETILIAREAATNAIDRAKQAESKADALDKDVDDRIYKAINERTKNLDLSYYPMSKGWDMEKSFVEQKTMLERIQKDVKEIKDYYIAQEIRLRGNPRKK